MKCNCSSYNGFLTVRGYAEHAQRELELDALDAMDTRLYLDSRVSVSAMAEAEDMCDHMLDEQYRRFHNGT